MIHVCYGLYDKSGRYSKFTATSMVSIFENVSIPVPSVTVHILHDNTLSQENHDKLVYIAGRYGQIVKFYNVSEICPDKIDTMKNMMKKAKSFERFTVGTLFRLVMHYVLPQDIDKVIYLDADIIVNLDIKALWQIELENKPLATVAEFDMGIDHSKSTGHLIIANGTLDYKNYFCAGVLFINLAYIRNETGIIERGAEFISNSGDCNYFDQDVLNYCFSENYIHLPEKFDVFVYQERKRRNKLRPAIYHYAGYSLRFGYKDAFNKLWFKYLVMTPFFNENTIEHFYEGLRQFHIQQKEFARRVSAIVSGKTRAFFVIPNNIEGLKQLFWIKPDEEIILANSADSVQAVINSLKNSAGKKIFFILTGEFPAVYETLTRAGLKPGEDFVNALEFLSDAEGVPLNSYSLVKLL